MQNQRLISVAPVIPAAFLPARLDQWIFERTSGFINGNVLEVAGDEGIISPIGNENGFTIKAGCVSSIANEARYDAVILLNKGYLFSTDKTYSDIITSHLKKDGFLIIQLPSKVALYKGLDDGLNSWKNSNWAYIHSVIGLQYEILKIRYFIVSEEVTIDPCFGNGYLNRIAMFSKDAAAQFSETGFSALIVGRKK